MEINWMSLLTYKSTCSGICSSWQMIIKLLVFAYNGEIYGLQLFPCYCLE